MCLLAIGIGCYDAWPLVLAANRDEYYDRPTAPPAVLGEEPQRIGGRDLRAGGTWLGLNQRGLVAAITNRQIEPPEVSGRPSRGQLCLDALRCASAREAADAVVRRLREGPRNPFNLVLGDRRTVFVLSNVPDTRVTPLVPGWHVIANRRMDDPDDPRVRRAQALLAGIMDRGSLQNLVQACEQLCRDHGADSEGPGISVGALCVHGPMAGTRSSSVIVLDEQGRCTAYRHAEGPPCRTPYVDVKGPR